MAARPTGTSNKGSTSTQTVSPSSTTTTGSSTGRETSSSSSTVQSSTQNMTGSALAALDSLILGLSGGSGSSKGNPLFGGDGGGSVQANTAAANAIKKTEAQYNQQVLNAQQLQSDYSKSAAFADSNAAVAATLADALEQAMPAITAGIDAAGTSGSALSALLTQKAAADAAAEGAKLGLSAAIDYGNIAVAAGNTATGLLQSGNPLVNALLESLSVAKGAVSNTTEKTSSAGSSTSNTKSTQTTLDSGKTLTTTESPTGSVGKSTGRITAPETTAVTRNTGNGWKTTYGV